MVNFLENHDEVRFGSTAYAYDPMRAVASLVVCATISTSPVLIYYGQELGERATDNEGFAGDNNRSTIFDYWSYPTMRRWYNNGKCDGGRSSEKEIKLRETYKKILTLCNKRNEISNGQFFDLMYANKENSEINPDRQFAFLRYNDKHTLLVAVNFDYKKVRCGIFIPEAAFEATGINEMALNTVELLSGKATNISISKVEPLRIDIEAGGAIIIEIK
jgi:glycosidase